MNLLDYFILAILAISSVVGGYNGFVSSFLNIIAFFLSWAISLMFSPIVASLIIARYPNLLQILIDFSEGALRIDSVQERALYVSNIPQERIIALVRDAHLPPPFDRLLLSNLTEASLDNLQTLAEYFNHSIANVIVNILSFILVYLVVRLLFSVVISIAKAVVGLPVLKQLDGLLGVGLGFIRGLFIVSLFFLVVPLVMTLAPIDIITMYVDTSILADLFWDFNIFAVFISGKT